ARKDPAAGPRGNRVVAQARADERRDPDRHRVPHRASRRARDGRGPPVRREGAGQDPRQAQRRDHGSRNEETCARPVAQGGRAGDGRIVGGGEWAVKSGQWAVQSEQKRQVTRSANASGLLPFSLFTLHSSLFTLHCPLITSAPWVSRPLQAPTPSA